MTRWILRLACSSIQESSIKLQSVRVCFNGCLFLGGISITLQTRAFMLKHYFPSISLFHQLHCENTRKFPLDLLPRVLIHDSYFNVQLSRLVNRMFYVLDSSKICKLKMASTRYILPQNLNWIYCGRKFCSAFKSF